MVEHNEHTDNLLTQSTDLGTADMSLVICILKLEAEIARGARAPARSPSCFFDLRRTTEPEFRVCKNFLNSYFF